MPNLMTRIAKDLKDTLPALPRLKLERKPSLSRSGWRAALYAGSEDADAALWVSLPLLGFLSLGAKLPGGLPASLARWITREPLRRAVEVGVWVGQFAVGEDFHVQIDLGNPSHGRYDPDKPWYWQRPIYLEIDPRFWLLGREVVQKLSVLSGATTVPLSDGKYPCRIEITHYRCVRARLAHFAWAGRTYRKGVAYFAESVPVGGSLMRYAAEVMVSDVFTFEEVAAKVAAEIARVRDEYGWTPDPPADAQLKLPLKN